MGETVYPILQSSHTEKFFLSVPFVTHIVCCKDLRLSNMKEITAFTIKARGNCDFMVSGSLLIIK